MTKAGIGRSLGYLGIFAAGALMVGLSANRSHPEVAPFNAVYMLYRDEATYVRYRYGSYPVARQALLEHINLLQAEEGPGPAASHLSHDVMLSYGRLAVIAEKAGANAERDQFLTKATMVLGVAGRKAVNAQEVLALVAALDEDWDARLKAEPAGSGRMP